MRRSCITYHLDPQGNIVYVDEAWDAMAEQQQGSFPSTAVILGRNIFDFISDESCRHIYQSLIDQVQQKAQSLSFPFRCDAPETRRFMEMEIFPVAGGITGFKSCIINEEPRLPVALLEPDAEKSDALLVICSWCMKVKVDAEHWLEMEQAIEHLAIFDVHPLPQLSHGICPGCYAAMTRDL
ncbi:MAG: PAS domain-containing protein [Gammaproteobacteria bacterium]